MIRLADVSDAVVVHETLLSAKNDIPLKGNFADEAHKGWVREKCERQDVWLSIYNDGYAGVMVLDNSEIFYLVVKPQCRRQGVGFGLVAQAISLLRSSHFSYVTARVHTGNRVILKLLIKMGFRVDPRENVSSEWTRYTCELNQ